MFKPWKSCLTLTWFKKDSSVFCHLSLFLVSFSSHFLCRNMVSKKPFRLPLSSRFQSNSLIIPSNSHLWSRLQTRLNYWFWCQIDAKLRRKSWFWPPPVHFIFLFVIFDHLSLMMIHFRFVFQILKQRNHNITVQELVLSSLAKHGYSSPNDKCLLQCFELSTLEGIKGQTQKLGYYKNRENHKPKVSFLCTFSLIFHAFV